jgi:hypothetical protein
MLHSLLDAFCEGFAAHREYERLTSIDMRHDLALRAAISETSHSRQASTRRTSIRSAFLIVVAAVGAWIDRGILRAKAGLLRLLIGMEEFQ